MKLKDIMITSDAFTDELQTKIFATNFANQALSIINTEVGLLLPFIKDMNEEYIALPSSWFQRLIGFFIMYGIKMNDGSMNEALEYKEEFEKGLRAFGVVAIGADEDGGGGQVDPEFIDPNALSNRFTKLDPSQGVNMAWFGGLDNDPNNFWK